MCYLLVFFILTVTVSRDLIPNCGGCLPSNSSIKGLLGNLMEILNRGHYIFFEKSPKLFKKIIVKPSGSGAFIIAHILIILRTSASGKGLSSHSLSSSLNLGQSGNSKEGLQVFFWVYFHIEIHHSSFNLRYLYHNFILDIQSLYGIVPLMSSGYSLENLVFLSHCWRHKPLDFSLQLASSSLANSFSSTIIFALIISSCALSSLLSWVWYNLTIYSEGCSFYLLVPQKLFYSIP